MADYDSLKQQQVTRLLELLPEYLERPKWSTDRLRAERQSRLRTLVAHAKEHSAWHRRRLSKIDADTVREEDLSSLPVMTKDDLMEHFDEIVTDPRLTREVVETHLDGLTSDAYLLDEYHVCASGGSSGRRGIFVYDREAWVVTFLSYMRFSVIASDPLLGGEIPVTAMIAADKPTHMTNAMGTTFAPPIGTMRLLSANAPLERNVAELNTLQPNSLRGYASIINQLAHEALAGRLRIAPKVVATTSEPLLPEIRAAVAEAWSVPIQNGFGSTEGLMGGSCSAHRGMHLSEDLCIVEPVDADGKPVPPGERAAKVYLTNLCNLTEPLIRYELTDEMTVIDEECPCGITMLRIDDIQGRLDDCFVYPGGPTVHPFTFRSILGRARNVVEYQVRQTERGADVKIRCQDRVDTGALRQALTRALADQGLADADVSITPVETLGRQALGKLKRFVPLSG